MTTTTERAKAPSSAEDSSLSKRLKALFGNQQVILLLVLLAMIAFFTSRNSIFFSVDVAGNVLLDWGPIVLIAVGETFVIISGGIDLSVGATAGIAGIMAAYVMQDMTTAGQGETITLLVGTLVCALSGAAVGLLNAVLINRGRIVPFIATLATLSIAGGSAVAFTGGAPIAGGPPNAINLSVPWLGPFSTPGLIVVAIVVVSGLYLHKSRFGRYTYAIGSNPFAARAAGINVKRHLAKIYILSGVLAGLAGMFFYLRLASGAPTSGAGGELVAIAAVVIGGASLAGGVGRMTGTVLGSLILTTVTSGLIIIGVAPNWNRVVVGVMIAAAACIQSLRTTSRDN